LIKINLGCFEHFFMKFYYVFILHDKMRLNLRERSQPKKSSILWNLIEKYISINCPRQFKFQSPTGLDRNKWSFYRQLSSGCLVVVGNLRYIGLSANQQAKNSDIAKWPLEAAKWSVDGLEIWFWSHGGG
jgi:hypothetical protein